MKSAYQSSSRKDLPFSGFTSPAVMPDMQTKMDKKEKELTKARLI